MLKRVILLLGVAGIALSIFCLPMRAQASSAIEVPSEISSLPVKAFIDGLKEAADELTAKAFERLDRTVLLAAQEARATINSAGVQLVEFEQALIKDLDEQQRRLVLDLLSLERAIDQSLQGLAGEIDANFRTALSSVNLLLSKDAGSIRVIPSFAIYGDKEIEFAIKGDSIIQC